MLSGNYQYEHEKGKMIYAIIKAESESDARKISDLLVKEVNESIFGTDYIN